MALAPEETIEITDEDKAAADRIETAMDAAMRGRRAREFVAVAPELRTSDLAVRTELARRYRKHWHVYDVEDLDKPLRLVAP